MDRRVVGVFTAFCLMIGALCLRLYVLSSKGTEYVVSEAHYRTIDIQNIRGDIYDCRGLKLVASEYSNVAVMKPALKALKSVEDFIGYEKSSELKERMEKGNIVEADIGMNSVDGNDDVLTVRKYRRYSEKQPARHIIGYVDSDGRGVTGLEKSFDSLLFTGKNKQIRFSADAYGRIISGCKAEKMNFDTQTGSVYLTLDSGIQKITDEALDTLNVKEGGAVVADVRTGAIRAMSSRPDYDSYNLSEYLNLESSPMVNRTVEAYAVGSVFKAAVAAAALENGTEDFYYTCTGTCDVDGIEFGCNNHKAHGELNMQKALECSCNTYFIKLAQEIGGDAILETVRKLGFGEEIKLADGISSASGVLPSEESLKNSGSLANFSFGQGDFTATMLQMVQLFSAIANGGKYTVPYLVERTLTADGEETLHNNRYPVVALSEHTSERLKQMLVSVVENGNAKKAKLNNEIKAAGKTATAQTGVFNEKGTEIYNTWFCGFFPADEPKYVIVILKQGGSSGAEDCAPVFKEIADKISQLN